MTNIQNWICTLLPQKLLCLVEVLTRMVLREKSPRVLPNTCGGVMSAIFMVLVPMLGCLALAGLWMFRSKQVWEIANSRQSEIQHTILNIGQVIMDFNIERELTAMYVTARSDDSQLTLKTQLDKARKNSDQSVKALFDWPGSLEEGQMFKSRILFNAVLGRHRTLVRVNSDFRDEVQYYTDLIDVIYGWLHKYTQLQGEQTELWQWLLTYSYLMGSINYIGAEQALCSVFHSIICFSHRETLYYANYSFGGEAVFRLYRQTYPGPRDSGWRTLNHDKFFPELNRCRAEIYSDLDYIAMSLDPSLCDYSRKNETLFHETDLLMVEEHDHITEALNDKIEKEVLRTTFEFLISGVVLGGIFCYVALLHIIRCTCIKCVQMRKTRKWRMKEIESVVMTEDKMESDHLGLNADHMMLHAPPTTNIYRYEDYNCKPNAIRVATV